MATATDAQSFLTAVLAFRDAWRGYDPNDANSRTALVGAASSLATSVSTLISENKIAASVAGHLGVVAGLVSFGADVKAYDDAVALGEIKQQNSALLAIVSDISGVGAGTSAILTPLMLEDPPVAGSLALAAAGLTTVSLGAQGMKSIYDAGNEIQDYLDEIGDELKQDWIGQDNLWHSAFSDHGGLYSALTSCCVNAANAAELGDTVSFSSSNGIFSSTITSSGAASQAQQISITKVNTDPGANGASATTTAVQQSNGSWQVTLTDGTAISITGSQNFANGASNLDLGGTLYFQDGAGNAYALSPDQSANGTYQITALANGATISLSADATSHIDLSGSGLMIGYGVSEQFQWQPNAGASGAVGDYYRNGVLMDTVQGTQTILNSDEFGASTPTTAGALGELTHVNSDGSLGSQTPYFQGSEEYGPPAPADAASLETSLATAVPLDTPTGTIDNSKLSVGVIDLAAAAQSNWSDLGASGTVTNNEIAGSGGALVSAVGQANTDLADVSSVEIASGYVQPGWERGIAATSDLYALTAFLNGTSLSSLSDAQLTGDASLLGTQMTYVDPLLIDVSGAGISVSNWIDNSVYFDTTGSGALTHTSWMGSGTGMLVFDPTGGAITNITQTVSEFLDAGPTPGKYADGLAALAALAESGTTAFNAETSLIDPKTGKSYWSELVVWTGSTGSGTGTMQSLDSLGITSISLEGSGNQGESIDGSSVTNSTNYTKSDGSLGQAAAVAFQTSGIGDVTTTASGGTLVTATAETGTGQAATYVAENSTAHVYSVSGGALTDVTTGTTVVASGVTAVLSSTQSDVISVAAGDTGTYWLGGGSGADTLTGGGGTNVFLVNPATVVHGGTGADSFNIAKVIGSAAITIDLKTDYLQEVIGGAGDGVFNASGTTWNVFIQGGTGNNIMIGGAAAAAAISGGTGDDLIELGAGGGVVHAGAGNDVIYGGSGTTAGKPNSDVIYAGAGNDIVQLGTDNAEVYDGTGTLTVIGQAGAFSVLGLHGSYADYTLTHNADGTVTVTNIDDMDGDGTVTMKNVTDVDFKDISQIAVSGTAGMPVDDELNTGNAAQVTTNAAGQYIIAAATLLANDLDYAGSALAIRELLDNNGNAIARGASGAVNGGTAALSADGTTITFTPSAGFSGVMSFRYHIEDSAGNDGAMVEQVGTTNTAEMTATVYLNTPDMPTDPLLDKEWFLQAADVIPVWKDYTGAGVSVGVFDVSGNVDFSNADLAANAGASVKIDGTPGVETIGTHATLVAGVIAAADDGEGAVGVAPDATIGSEALDTSTLQDANLMDWSKYDVVNNSWGVLPGFSDYYLDSSHTKLLSDALTNAVDNGRGGLGTAVVFSGGNDRQSGANTNDFLNTNSRYTITVGGIDATTDLGSLVISGKPFGDPGASILVSAPANNITSDGVSYSNDFGQQFGASTETAAGTSFAAPIVSGVIADMLQANPNLGYRDIQRILAYSAVEVDPTGSDWAYNGATNWNGGGLHTCEDYGFGEVDARAAVRLAETWGSADAQTAANEKSFAFNWGYTASHTNGTPLNVALTSPVSSHETLYGFSMNVEHVNLEINVVDVNLNDLVVTLTSPTGVVSTLMNGATSAISGTSSTETLDYTFDSVRDYGESLNYQNGGTWTWQISYASGTPVAAETGAVEGVSLTFYGEDTSSGGQTYVYTDEFAQLSADPNNGARSTLTGTGQGDTLNAAAVSTSSVIDLNAGSTDSVIAGRALTLASTAKFTAADGGDGNDTLIANSLGDFLYGGRGNDTLIGGTGNDTLDGGAGNDTLIGGGGADTYDFNGNAGQDVIVNGTGTGGASGGLVLGGGLDAGTVRLDPANLWLAESGNDLVIQELGTTTQTTVKEWFAATSSELQSLILSDGSAIGTAAISALANAMAVYQAANPSFSSQTATALPMDATLAAALDADWARTITGTGGNDTLDGSIGNDVLIGYGGNDTYDYGPGYGQDTIVNGLAANSGPTGTLQLGSGFIPGDLWFSRSGNDLVVQELGSSDDLTIQNWFANSYSELQTIVAGDGSTISAAAVNAMEAAMAAYQAANPSFNPQTAGTVMPAALTGALADDWVTVLTGTSGNDTLDPGGSGNDMLIGAGGDDTYEFDLGYGQDVIVNGTGTGSPSGQLVLGAGLTTNRLWFSASGNDLVVQVLGSASRMTVQNWIAADADELQSIVACDGTTIDSTAVGQLLAAMTSYQQSNPGFDPTTAVAMPAALQAVLTSYWTEPGPNLSVAAASGNPGTTIALSVSASLTAQEAADSLSITLSGLPTGATLSAGTQNADGSWTLTAAQLSGLTLTAPTAGRFAGTAHIIVTATALASDGIQTSRMADLPVSIAGVATAPTLSVTAAAGKAGSAIALSIVSALTATDGAESLSITITGVPSGASLSSGTKNDDGSWSLNPAQLSGLTLLAPAGSFAGTANLTVTATATETDGSTASSTANLPVVVAGTAAVPTLSVKSALGNPGTAIPLSIAAALMATDGTESLSLTIAGLPSGATLSSGTRNADGSWTLSPAQLAGLALTVPSADLGTFNLAVTATATETDGSTASTAATLPLTVNPPLLATSANNAVLQAGTGNNTLIANGSNDMLIGGSGADTLIANGSHDTLIGGSGADTLVSTGSNTLIGGGGVDTLLGASDDTLIGSSGMDTLIADGPYEMLIAGSGTDTLLSCDEYNMLIGGSGADVLISEVAFGSMGATLIAGSGLNTLISDGLSDIMIAGDGAREVLLGEGCSGDTLIGGSGADTLVLDQGSASTLIGGSGVDTLVSDDYADSNTLVGGSGADTFVFGGDSGDILIAGSGAAYFDLGELDIITVCTIQNYHGASMATNELDFGSGVSDNQLWFQQQGNDLEIVGMKSQFFEVFVENWFVGAGNQLAEITAGGLKFDNSKLAQLVQAMATYSAANPGFDPRFAYPRTITDPTVLAAVNSAWHQ